MCHSHSLCLVDELSDRIDWKNEMALIFNHIMFPFRLYFRFQCRLEPKRSAKREGKPIVHSIVDRESSVQLEFSYYFDIFVVCCFTHRAFTTLQRWFIRFCRSVKTSQCVYQMLRWNIECAKNKPIHKQNHIEWMLGKIMLRTTMRRTMIATMINYARPAECNSLLCCVCPRKMMWKMKRTIHPWPFAIVFVCRFFLSTYHSHWWMHFCSAVSILFHFGYCWQNWQRIKHHW